MRKLLTSVLISASMIGAVPAAAVAQTSTSASKLSVVSARANAQSGGEKLADGAGGIIAIALLAGIAAIVVLAAINNDDNATSP